jgi:hypothetical protein
MFDQLTLLLLNQLALLLSKQSVLGPNELALLRLN